MLKNDENDVDLTRYKIDKVLPCAAKMAFPDYSPSLRSIRKA